MNLNESLTFLNRNGYCLWVGAGICCNLSEGTNIKIPTWKNLVEELEKAANLISPKVEATLPERLEIILSHLNTYTFRIELRRLILKQLALAVIEQIEKQHNKIPQSIRALSKLGFLANPIINFNVETLTSQILSAGGGHFSIKTYGKREFDDNWTISQGSNYSMRDGIYENQRFKRHIYHPHGNIDGYGVSVFTDEDYKRHSHSLAYQLATHSAFDDNLVIVGMSLDDKYLREQLGNFRKEIKQVYWFQTNKQLAPEIEKWCWRYDIKRITFDSWSDFWNEVDSILAGPSELDLLTKWMTVVNASIDILNDSHQAEKLLQAWKDLEVSDAGILRHKINFSKRGIVISESLNSPPLITDGKSREIHEVLLKELSRLIKE